MTHALLILGGEPPPPSLVHFCAASAQFIIAADSGFDALAAAHLQPNLVVGDFDSIRTPLNTLACPKFHAPEQSATDFEKAIRHLPATTTRLSILGGTGRRVDHFLTNLLITANLPPHLQVQLLDPLQSIFRITPACPLHLHAHTNASASIIPFTSCTNATSSGLRWNLNHQTLAANAQLSQSNQLAQPNVSFTIQSGTAFFILNHPSDFSTHTLF